MTEQLTQPKEIAGNMDVNVDVALLEILVGKQLLPIEIGYIALQASGELIKSAQNN